MKTECCNDSLQGDMEIATKRMVKQCFGYEPSNESVHRTVQEIFFAFSPMLGNKDKGFLECGSDNFKIMEQRLLHCQDRVKMLENQLKTKKEVGR